MGHFIGDRIRETSSTTGTGNFTSTGAVSGFDTLASLLASNGDTTWYGAVNGAEWEVGLLTRLSSTSFARTTIYQSSNSDAAVSFTAGPEIFVTVPAKFIVTNDVMGPAFRAYVGTTLTGWPSGSYQVIPFNTESFDTAGAYTPGTGQFNPKVPGYYRVSWMVTIIGTTNLNGGGSAKLYKNGAAFSEAGWNAPNANAARSGSSDLVFMNGTTDYLEVWAYGSGSGVTINGGSVDQSYFNAELVAAQTTPVLMPPPVVAVRQSAQQAFTASVYAKVTFATEEIDSAGAWDTSTSRFQPTTAGYYQFHGNVTFTATSSYSECVVYKNGAVYKTGIALTGNSYGTMISGLVYLNGTTDYIELWAMNASSISTNATLSNYTYFHIALVSQIGLPPSGGPAFAVRLSAAQAFSASTYTKIAFNTEEFDTNNAFDAVTNSRFQPQVAGYYQIEGGIAFASPYTLEVAIYKNGAIHKVGAAGSSAYGVNVSAVVFLNGSSDYVELWGFTGTAASTFATVANYTHFSGHLARLA
jgi:hypothetical protein